MTQLQINQAHRRSLKTSYKGLTALEKRIVKYMEKEYQLELSVKNTYRLGKIKYGEDFRQHPNFQDDFERIFFWDEEIIKISERITRLEEKHGVNRNEIMKKHRMLNRRKSYGGSF